ncbi:MAG: nucleotidyltransferase family protein [Solirubrobacterales bacterium]
MAPSTKTKTHQALTRSQREAVRELVARHGGSNVRIFGSHARGEAGPSSDIDLLVDMDRESSLLDLIAIKYGVQDELGFEVDVVTEAGLSRHLKDQVLREAVPV